MKFKLSPTDRRPNTRAHYVLFAEDTPFKPKVVKRKDTYRRNDKHRKRGLSEI